MNNKTILSKLLALFIISFVILFVLNPVYAENPVEEVKKNIIRVVAKNTAGEVLGWCAGFVIGVEEPYEYVVTNWHILNPEQYGINRVDTFIMISANDFIPARVFHHLTEPDIAILKIDPEHLLYGLNPLELGNRNLAKTGETIYQIGFNYDGEVELRISLNSEMLTTIGILNNISSWNGIDVYQTTAAVDRGNSGGPLVNEKGQILGINSFVMIESAEINGSVQIDYLNDFLISRNIPFLAADVDNEGTKAKKDNDDINYLLVGGIIASVLVMAAIILVSKKSGNKRKPTAKPSAKPASRPSPPPVKAGRTPLQVGGDTSSKTQAVFPHKERKEEPSGVEKISTKEARPLLIGIAGQFAGKVVDFIEGQIVIGRDPRLAQLIYPQQNTDISRKHCTLRFDAKTYKFIVEDSSSNGTYLSSNEKLEPGKPYYLNSGDRFYLAKPSEVFEVKLDL